MCQSLLNYIISKLRNYFKKRDFSVFCSENSTFMLYHKPQNIDLCFEFWSSLFFDNHSSMNEYFCQVVMSSLSPKVLLLVIKYLKYKFQAKSTIRFSLGTMWPFFKEPPLQHTYWVVRSLQPLFFFLLPLLNACFNISLTCKLQV